MTGGLSRRRLMIASGAASTACLPGCAALAPIPVRPPATYSSAADFVAALAARQVSSLELVDASIERIETFGTRDPPDLIERTDYVYDDAGQRTEEIHRDPRAPDERLLETAAQPCAILTITGDPRVETTLRCLDASRSTSLRRMRPARGHARPGAGR